MSDKFFIDSNVIADYILFKIALDVQKKTEDEYIQQFKKKEYQKQHNRIINSYKLIRDIIQGKIGIEVFISPLVLAEVTSVIMERQKISVLVDEGLHPSEWYKMKDSIKLSPPIQEEISNQMIIFLSDIKRKKMKITDNVDISWFLSLSVMNNFETYDSYLISQAMAEKCNFFVTNDKRLSKRKKFLPIKVVSSQECYGNLKRT